jgi:HTH-type transcriptional regulator / antitoxin MqsA
MFWVTNYKGSGFFFGLILSATETSYEEEGKYFLVEHVPAEVCERCGEKTYSPEVTDELLKFARDKFKPVKKLEVPVFDFAESC